MDEIVIRSMLKWPDVPAVYGWLALDRRGTWLIKTAAGRLERISNPALIEFIGRNYGNDGDGRWYFQNGPQRVFVGLHYTPWVYRLDDRQKALITHTGDPAGALRAGWLDESGTLLLEGERGVGVVSDRDLPTLVTTMTDAKGRAPDAMLEAIARGEGADCRLLGQAMRIEPVRAVEVPARFAFVPHPAPRPGEPEC
jgi:hypothetical protein